MPPALFYGIGGGAVIEGRLSLGTLTAMVALLARLYGPLTQLSNLRIDLMTAMVSFERVFEVLDLKPSIYDAHDSIDVPGPPSIEFDKVWFTYPTASEVSLSSLTPEADREQKRGEKVLSEISFYVEPGQTVALVAVRGGQDHHHPPGGAPLRGRVRGGARRWCRRAGPEAGEPA